MERSLKRVSRKSVCLGLLLLSACASAPHYEVSPDKLADAAYLRGVWKTEGFLGDWFSMSLLGVDGVEVGHPVLRKSEADPRPIESGNHRLVLAVEGVEDKIPYYASLAVEMVLLARTHYAMKGQIAVDKVVVWIEREDHAEPVIAPVAIRRFQKPPIAPVYIPVNTPI